MSGKGASGPPPTKSTTQAPLVVVVETRPNTRGRAGGTSATSTSPNSTSSTTSLNIKTEPNGITGSDSEEDDQLLLNSSTSDMPIHSSPSLQGLLRALECPVCLSLAIPPIFQCETGHSICGKCTEKLKGKTCGLCKKNMTNVRSFGLESIFDATNFHCSFAAFGCRTIIPGVRYQRHIEQECNYRELKCNESQGLKCVNKSMSMHDFVKHLEDYHSVNVRTTSGSKQREVKAEIEYIHIGPQMIQKRRMIEVVKFDSKDFLIVHSTNANDNTNHYWWTCLIGTWDEAKDYYVQYFLANRKPGTTSEQGFRQSISWTYKVHPIHNEDSRILETAEFVSVPKDSLKLFSKACFTQCGPNITHPMVRYLMTIRIKVRKSARCGEPSRKVAKLTDNLTTCSVSDSE